MPWAYSTKRKIDRMRIKTLDVYSTNIIVFQVVFLQSIATTSREVGVGFLRMRKCDTADVMMNTLKKRSWTHKPAMVMFSPVSIALIVPLAMIPPPTVMVSMKTDSQNGIGKRSERVEQTSGLHQKRDHIPN